MDISGTLLHEGTQGQEGPTCTGDERARILRRLSELPAPEDLSTKPLPPLRDEDESDITWPQNDLADDPLAAALASTEPGPELATLLASLDPKTIRPAVLTEAIDASERQLRWTNSAQYRFLFEAQRRAVLVEGSTDSLSAEVSARFVISSAAAEARLDDALEIGLLDPVVERAMARGEIDRGRALIIARETAFLDKHVGRDGADQLVRKLAGRAPDLTAGKLRHLVRTAVNAIMPPEIHEERHEAALANRHVDMTILDDGMAELRAYLAAPDAKAAMLVLDRLAQPKKSGDKRTKGQRCADAFASMFRRMLDAGESPEGLLPTAQRHRPHLMIAVETVAGSLRGSAAAPRTDLDPSTASTHAKDRAGGRAAVVGTERSKDGLVAMLEGMQTVRISLDGYGPITPRMAQRAAQDAELSFVVHNPRTGERHHEVLLHSLAAADVLDALFRPGAAESDAAVRPAGADVLLTAEAARAGPEIRRDAPIPLSGSPPMTTPRSVAWPDMIPLSDSPPGAPTQLLTSPPRTHAAEGTGKIEARAQVIAESGHLVAAGYRPTLEIIRSVLLRDGTCCFPTCRLPAWRCDLDHIEPFDPNRPATEQTHEDNLHALCRRHHRLKTYLGWSVRRDRETGITHWTSPTGHSISRRAEYLEQLVLVSPHPDAKDYETRNDVQAVRAPTPDVPGSRASTDSDEGSQTH